MQISSPRIFATTALATVFCAQSALADLTAADVWESWQSYMESYGYKVTAYAENSGGTLSVTNLAMEMSLPEDEGDFVFEWGSIDFVENGDGTVSIVLPESGPIGFQASGDGEDVSVKMTMTTDLKTLVSGSLEEMKYTYSSEETSLEVTELVVDDEVVEDLDFDIVMNGLAGESELLQGEMSMTRGTSSIASLAVLIKGVDPDTDEAINVSATVSGMTAQADAAIPETGFADDPADFFVPGMQILGGYTFNAMTMAVNFVEDGTPGAISFESGGGTFSVDMDDSQIGYSGSLTDLALQAMGADIPVPIDVSFGEIGYGFQVPIAASDDEQDFAFNLKLEDLKVSELLWGMFDPGQVLPRDPATLVVDLVGKGTVLMDLFTLDEDTSEMPGELNALTIRDVHLNAAGASVQGSGDFVFDNSDLESFDGLPRPEGALDVNITGVNGLMDKLIQMGLLPEEQAMGARMMMSMFTQPGDGADTLTSKVEVNAQGHVLANGQRLK